MQIQKEASRLSGKQIQDEGEEINTNSVFVIVQKEVNPTKKQTTKTPYRHPNYKLHFDQRHGQNESEKKEHQIKILNNKREDPSHKAIK